MEGDGNINENTMQYDKCENGSTICAKDYGIQPSRENCQALGLQGTTDSVYLSRSW